MKFAFFGSSLVSAYWNGAATYYRGLIRNLHALGHQITFYEPDAYGRQQHRDIADPPWARSVVYGIDSAEPMERALEDAAAADVIVKTSGIGIFDAALEEGVLALRRPGHLAVFWDVDAPATLDEVARDPHHPFRRRIPRFDLVCTYGGGHPVVNAYRKLGARHCEPIYNALDTHTHYPVPVDPTYAADLAFLGNRLPDREERVRAFFIDVAARRPDSRFLLGGSGWESCGLTSNVHHIGHVYTRDHNAFNSTPRAVLNISRDSMARYGYSPATRVFEAAGAGACLITDQWEGVEFFLEPGSEVLVARNGDEVAEHLDALTAERATSIGRAALERVRAEHTYAHRVAQLEALLEGRAAAPTAAVA
ncbi:CgeB family protein [Dyella sp. KRB-257]|uniref:CgeB family protein n=1 Tax=Dyella sp. KRB-257 TaxID=3400915 RepID=UPI003BFE11B7